MKRKITDIAESNTLSGDTYLKNGGSLIELFSVRLVLLCVFSVSLVWLLCDVYMLELNFPLLLLYTGIFTAVLYTLCSLFNSGLVYIFAAAAFGLIYNWDIDGIAKFTGSHFAFYLDGRIVSTAYLASFPSEVSLHSSGQLPGLMESNLLFMLFVGGLISFLTVIFFRKRLRVFPAVCLVTTLLIPSFVAERVTFYVSFAVLFAVCFAFHAIRSSYELEGAYLFGKYSVFHAVTRHEKKKQRSTNRFAMLGAKLSRELRSFCKYSANSIVAFILVLSVMLSVYAISGKGNYIDYSGLYKSAVELYDNISVMIGDFFSVSFGEVSDNGYFVDYSSDESINNGISISAPSDSNLPVLKVVTENEAEPIYLRGDIGVSFGGESWSTLADKNFYAELDAEPFFSLNTLSSEEVLANYYPEVNYQTLRQKLAYLGYSPNEFLPLEKVSLTYQKNTRVVFQPLYPYELNYKNSESFDSFGDFVLRLKKHISGIKTYESLALVPRFEGDDLSLITELIQLGNYDEAFNFRWILPEAVRTDEYQTYQELYNNLVETVYVKVPDSENENIERFYRENKAVLDNTAYPQSLSRAEALCRIFKSGYTYSLNADNDGGGNTALGSFLFDTKTGHCALYATAMTLTLRHLGIPARYVTGYVVNGGGTKNDDGYEYVMRENNLHAWVEVYVSELGIWLPFDPTPAAAVSGDMSSSVTATSAPASSVTTPPVTTPPTSSPISSAVSSGGTDTATAPPDDAEKKTFAPLLPLCVIAAVAVALLVIPSVLYYRGLLRRERRIFRGFSSKEPQLAVREMNKLIRALLEKRSLTQQTGELPRIFAARVDRENPCGDKSFSFRGVIRIIEKAEFGNGKYSPVSAEERKAVLEYTTALYDVVVVNNGKLKRIFYKISLFS